MRESSPSQTDIFTLSGSVIDEETNKTLAGVTVALNNSVGTRFKTVTEEEGFFSFYCRSDNYTVSASLEGYVTYDRQVTVEDSNVTVNVIMSSKPVVPPPPPYSGATITGRVTDRKTAAPVEGANVAAGNYSVMTAINGTYSLDVKMGTYIVTVSLNGYKTETTSVIVSEEKAYSIDMSLTPIPMIKITADPPGIYTYSGTTSILKIVVETTDRTPAAGVTVHLTNTTHGMPAKFDSQVVITDALGMVNVKWQALLEPVDPSDIRTWDCLITASATVDGLQVEQSVIISVLQPCVT